MLGLLLFFALVYVFGFIGVQILRHKLRKMQQRAEERADEGRTQYADGQIIYSKTSNGRKHFRETDGEYVDYEEVK